MNGVLKRPCWKEGHGSKGKADAAMRSLQRRGLDRPEEGPLHTYRCRECEDRRGTGGEIWHVGHDEGPNLFNPDGTRR